MTCERCERAGGLCMRCKDTRTKFAEGFEAGRKSVGKQLIELAKGLAEHVDLAGVLPIALADIGRDLIEGKEVLHEWPVIIEHDPRWAERTPTTEYPPRDYEDTPVDKAIAIIRGDVQHCGHPLSAIQAKGSTHHCRLCAEEAS